KVLSCQDCDSNLADWVASGYLTLTGTLLSGRGRILRHGRDDNGRAVSSPSTHHVRSRTFPLPPACSLRRKDKIGRQEGGTERSPTYKNVRDLSGGSASREQLFHFAHQRFVRSGERGFAGIEHNFPLRP